MSNLIIEKSISCTEVERRTQHKLIEPIAEQHINQPDSECRSEERPCKMRIRPPLPLPRQTVAEIEEAHHFHQAEQHPIPMQSIAPESQTDKYQQYDIEYDGTLREIFRGISQHKSEILSLS